MLLQHPCVLPSVNGLVHVCVYAIVELASLSNAQHTTRYARFVELFKVMNFDIKIMSPECYTNWTYYSTLVASAVLPVVVALLAIPFDMYFKYRLDSFHKHPNNDLGECMCVCFIAIECLVHVCERGTRL